MEWSLIEAVQVTLPIAYEKTYGMLDGQMVTRGPFVLGKTLLRWEVYK